MQERQLSMDDYMTMLDRALHRELLHGCSDADLTDNLRMSQKSQQALHAKPVSLIQHLRENPLLEVWYSSTITSPFSNTPNLLDVYVDEYKHEYWYDPKSALLVQSTPPPDQYQATQKTRRKRDRFKVAPLREAAHKSLEAHVPNFMQRRGALHPFEENTNGDIFYFRWDDYSNPLTESEEAPYIQISLKRNGKIHSFTNALSYG